MFTKKCGSARRRRRISSDKLGQIGLAAGTGVFKQPAEVVVHTQNSNTENAWRFSCRRHTIMSMIAILLVSLLSFNDRSRAFSLIPGTTFTKFVLKQRLSLARRLLLNARNGQRRISDITYLARVGIS
jgi:hypothetical protein